MIEFTSETSISDVIGKSGIDGLDKNQETVLNRRDCHSNLMNLWYADTTILREAESQPAVAADERKSIYERPGGPTKGEEVERSLSSDPSR